jgi:hypothetical protein
MIIWMWGDQEIWGVVSEPVGDFLYPIVRFKNEVVWSVDFTKRHRDELSEVLKTIF